MSQTGEFQTVETVNTRLYTGEIIRLQLECHSYLIESTPDNFFYVCSKSWDESQQKFVFATPQWKLSKYLSTDDCVGMHINTQDLLCLPLPFTHSLHFEHCFILGFYCGSDSTTEKLFQKNPLMQTFGTKHNRVLPEWLHNAPKKCIREFIDGFLCGKKATATDPDIIGDMSFNIAYGMQRLFIKLGFLLDIRAEENGKHSGKLQTTAKSFVHSQRIWYAVVAVSRTISQTLVYNIKINQNLGQTKTDCPEQNPWFPCIPLQNLPCKTP
jgi:hypothetical protein